MAFSQLLAKSYHSVAVANEIISLGREHGRSVNCEHLNFLMYLACGWYVAIFGVSLVTDKIVATHSGPVIETVRETFQGNGSKAILGLAKYPSSASNNDRSGEKMRLPHGENHEQVREFLQTFMQHHSNYAFSDLRKISLSADGPWAVARIGIESGNDIVIHPDVLRHYFFQLAAKSKNSGK